MSTRAVLDLTAGIGTSDHNLITVEISVGTPPETQQQPRRLWHFNKADLDGLRSFVGFRFKVPIYLFTTVHTSDGVMQINGLLVK